MSDDQPAERELPARPLGAAPPPEPGAPSHEERIRSAYPDDPPKPEEPKPDEAEAEAKPTTRIGEYNLTVPEGFEIAPEMVKEATPIFRDLGISDEGANKLLPLGAKLIERHEDAKLSEFDNLTKTWARESRDDPQIGRGKWADTERFISIALTAGGAGPDSEFGRLMTQSGLGNHPAVIKVLRTLGERLAKSGPAPKKTRSQILYPND